MNPLTFINRTMTNGICFYRSDGGMLRAELGGKRYSRVKLVRTFPYTMPEKFISVRTDEGTEIAIIRDVRLLQAESIRIVREELDRKYLIPKIKQILSMKKSGGRWLWQVDTDYGPAELAMDNLHENIHLIKDTCWIVTDSGGRRFELSDPERMDAVSRELWRRVN